MYIELANGTLQQVKMSVADIYAKVETNSMRDEIQEYCVFMADQHLALAAKASNRAIQRLEMARCELWQQSARDIVSDSVVSGSDVRKYYSGEYSIDNPDLYLGESIQVTSPIVKLVGIVKKLADYIVA